ncbi:hypothetical protein VTO42DRAFT_3928 [Malbranchea cinnamomea]
MKPVIAVPAISALVYRAYSRKSLTPLGIVVATLTAIVHAAHPSAAPFAFLTVFFLAGTAVTKVKHDVKATLTVSAVGGTGSSANGTGGEGPRTHVQVLANSGVASILVALHLWRMYKGRSGTEDGACFPYRGEEGLLMVGIVANYAAVAADTFSSELGILSKSAPRLITSLSLRKVPRGTNGGVTFVGLGAGALGAFLIALTSLVLLPFCSSESASVSHGEAWTWERKAYWLLGVTIWGTLGSLLDSVLGGLLQATVVDRRTGKVVEGSGGRKVLVHPWSIASTGLGEIPVRQSSSLHMAEDVANTLTPRRSRHEYDPLKSQVLPKESSTPESRKIASGHDILDNNDINFLMATLMSVGGMLAASYAWDISFMEGLF